MEKRNNGTITLSNGKEMPLVGLGTFLIEEITNITYEAIKNGIRLIDTASRYNNEKEVGQGINRAINEGMVKREDLFIITKLWVGDKENPEAAIKKSLELLNLDYVDAYLDHWPLQIFEWEGKNYSIPSYEVWKKMENLVRKGYTKSIGLSNYNVQRITDLLTYAEIKPVINQVELNPYLTQKNLVKYCKENDIQIMGYNVFCKGKYVDRFHKNLNLNLLGEPLIKELASNYSTTEGVISLSWLCSQGIVAITSTSKPERVKENLKATKIKLTYQEIERIDALNKNIRCNESSQWDFFKKVDLFA